MIQDVLEFASENSKNGKRVALVTVTNTDGSSPASIGQMIAVLADGSIAGTVGGGASEFEVITRAIEAIKGDEKFFSLSIDHAESGMICGGSMELFGNIIGTHTGLCIFGGGHIAQRLARIASETGFFVTVIEDRPEYASEFESARYVVCNPEDYDAENPAVYADYAVICTRGHSTDDKALRYCLGKSLKYIGMIGSKAKVAALFSKLTGEGISREALDRVYAPIGLDIADAVPAEIAVAILAEILLIKNKGSLVHKKDS